jgi:hypothetical protein
MPALWLKGKSCTRGRASFLRFIQRNSRPSCAPGRAAHPKTYSKCDKLPLHITTTISSYNKISKVYNLDSISNLLAKSRKISGRINRDIYIHARDVKITPYYMVKYQNNHLNCLNLRCFISKAKESLYPNNWVYIDTVRYRPFMTPPAGWPCLVHGSLRVPDCYGPHVTALAYDAWRLIGPQSSFKWPQGPRASRFVTRGITVEL